MKGMWNSSVILKLFEDHNPGLQVRPEIQGSHLPGDSGVQSKFRILFWRQMIFKVFASNLGLLLEHIALEYFLGKHTTLTVLLACKSDQHSFKEGSRHPPFPPPTYGPRAETMEGKRR